MAVSVTYNFGHTIVDTIALGLDLVTDANQSHAISGLSGTLSGTSTPVISKVWSDAVTLAAGAKTIDLTELAQGNLANVTFAGLKVQWFIMAARSANSSTVRVKVGAAEPYNIFGDANGEITLGAGAVCMFKWNEHLPDVTDTSATQIDFSSSDVDAIVDVIIAAG